MIEDRGALRINPGGEVVRHEAQDALSNRPHAVAVGNDLVVGDQHPGVDPAILQEHPVAQGAKVVTQVEVPRRAVTREDAETRRILVDGQVDLGAARLGSSQRGIGGGGFQGVFTACHALFLTGGWG